MVQIKICRSFGTIVAAALLTQAAFAEMHATEEFESGASRPLTIALLPAHVSLAKQRMIRREAQVDESGDLEAYLTVAVANGLIAKGYQVDAITAARVNADPQLQALVVESDRRFDELLGNVSRKLRKDIESRRYHAGDTITLLADRLNVDAIAFVRMDIVANSKALQVINLGMGGAQTMMSVSLVDKSTTDIEAYVTLPIMRRGKVFGGYDDIMSNPDEEMANYADATLGDLLDADPAARVDVVDEDILSELESLLD
jgi:hypothetical protein